MKEILKLFLLIFIFVCYLIIPIRSEADPDEDIKYNNTYENVDSVRAVEKLQSYDNEIDNEVIKIVEIQKYINEKEKILKNYEKKYYELQMEADKKDRILGNRIKALYENNEDRESILIYIYEIINSNNIMEAYRKAEMIKTVCTKDVKLIKEAQEAEKELENTLKQIKVDKTTLEKNKKEVKDRLEIVFQKKEEVEKYINDNRNLLDEEQKMVSYEKIDLENVHGISRELIENSKKYLGIPYLWGGTTPDGFDCSGFVQYLYKNEGINIPRTSQEQQHFCNNVELNELKPGDLVFNKESNSTHVGMYVGSGYYIHSPHTGDRIKISCMNNSNMNYGGRIIT